jgi:hypothetical protein
MWWVVNATPRPLYLLEKPGTYFVEGWVGIRDGLDEREKFPPHWYSIPELPSP